MGRGEVGANPRRGAVRGRESKRCSRCSYYFPVTMDQLVTVESQAGLDEWSPKAAHAVSLAMRRALMKCGVCGWRCILVAGPDQRGCEHWWRDE